MILHNKCVTTLEDVEFAERVIRSGRPEVEALEEDLCAYTGRRHAVAVASGLAALRLALLCKRGLLPTVPAYSCVALANAAYSFYDKLGIADVEPDKWNLDANDIADPENAAVVVVNTFGVPTDLPKNAGLVIEDSTHGFGLHRSEIEVLSFHSSKLIGGSVGGALLTDSKIYADAARDRRDYDNKPASGLRLNDKLGDVDAALVRSKLLRLHLILEERKELADLYFKELRPLQSKGLLELPYLGNNSWYRFVIRVKRHMAFMEAMFRKGVMTASPIEWWPDDTGPYPIAHSAYESLVSLPLYPGLTKAQVLRVCKAVGEVLQ